MIRARCAPPEGIDLDRTRRANSTSPPSRKTRGLIRMGEVSQIILLENFSGYSGSGVRESGPAVIRCGTRCSGVKAGPGM